MADESKQLNLIAAADFAARVAEMLRHAVEASAVERQTAQARMALETFTSRNEQLKSENTALQEQVEKLKKEHGEFVTIDEKTRALRALDELKIARTKEVQTLNRELSALKEKIFAA